MADNVPIDIGGDRDIAADDISSVWYQRVKLSLGGDGTANDAVAGAGAVSTGVQRVTLASDDPVTTAVQIMDDWDESDRAKVNPIVGQAGVAANTGAASATTQRVVAASDSPEVTSLAIMDDWDSSDAAKTVGFLVTCSTDVTRPADTTAYAANDALSDSTSAPTSGGFTFTGAGRASGGSGIITDAIITTSADPATTLSGEIWLFNTSVTNINDNAAFAVSDSEIKTYVGKIPFVLEDSGNNGSYHAKNLNIGYTCSGSANLRFLVRVKNAYTPANAEVLTFVIKCLQIT